MSLRLAPALAAAALAFLPAVASATVTQSRITTPSDGTLVLLDSNQAPTSITIAGTSDGASGDSVDILCYRAPDRVAAVTQDVPVDPDGSFSIDVTPDPSACLLRAVPSGPVPTGDAAKAFSGPRVYISAKWTSTASQSPHPVNGFAAYIAGVTGTTDVSGVGDCAICDWGPQTADPLTRANDLFEGGPALYPSGYDTDGDNTDDHTALTVDGHPSFMPSQGIDWAADDPQFPTVSWSYDGSALPVGATITETETPARCQADLLSPNSSNCADFVDTGVKLTRTYRFRNGASAVDITDTWTSTDGQAHDLGLVTEWDLDDSGSYRTSWAGGSDFVTDPAIPGAGGTGPFTLDLTDKANTPDNDPVYPRGSITVDQPPTGGGFYGDWMWLRFVQHIPAGGSTTMRYSENVARAQSDVDAASALGRDWVLAPHVAIGSPAAGSSVTAGTVRVTGSVTDPGGPTPTVTVNGVAATVSGDTWTADVPLAAGARTITAVARDGAGNQDTASVAVTVTTPPAPPAKPSAPPSPPLWLTGAAAQKLASTGAVAITAGCGATPCTLTANGTLSIPGAAKVYKLAPVSQKAKANKKVTLKLKLSEKLRARVRSALRHHRKVTARITVTATTAAGGKTTKHVTVRAKR